MESWGQGSCALRAAEFERNIDLYTHVAHELDGFAACMNPPPGSDSEVVGRTLLIFRVHGFFSAHRTVEEVVDVTWGMVLDLNGAPIDPVAMDCLTAQVFAGRQAALRRGFAGATETVQ
jgi:hypothetical protein